VLKYTSILVAVLTIWAKVVNVSQHWFQESFFDDTFWNVTNSKCYAFKTFYCLERQDSFSKCCI